MYKIHELDNETRIPSELRIEEDRVYLSNPETGLERSWSLDEIESVFDRTTEAIHPGVEIFFTDGTSILLDCFDEKKEGNVDQIITYKWGSDEVVIKYVPTKRGLEDARKLRQRIKQQLPRSRVVRDPKKWIKARQKKWLRGDISNFQYLLDLNKAAGRSFHDLNRYPVFPWVYLKKQYRDLSKSLGALRDDRRRFGVGRFKFMKQQILDDSDPSTVPFIWGTSYSIAGHVSRFLLRENPLSNIKLQSGKFDIPGRLLWDISKDEDNIFEATNEGSQLPELIPEFFYNPAFLENKLELDLGVRPWGERGGDVALPDGMKPKEFIRWHKKKLESAPVSQKLNSWADLIFGFQQRGEKAVEAVNLFFSLCYGLPQDFDNLSPVQKDAFLHQISDFGQVPDHLFPRKPHPQRATRPYTGKQVKAIAINKEELRPKLSALKPDEILLYLDETKHQLTIFYKDSGGSVCKAVLSKKKILKFQDYLDRNLLHLAVLEGNQRLISYLVKAFPEMLNTRDYQGKTPLYLAAEKEMEKPQEERDYSLVIDLLRAGTNPSIVDRQSNSLLHQAIEQGDLILVDLLLQAGAKLDTFDRQRRTPLDLAREKTRQIKLMRRYEIGGLKACIETIVGSSAKYRNSVVVVPVAELPGVYIFIDFRNGEVKKYIVGDCAAEKLRQLSSNSIEINDFTQIPVDFTNTEIDPTKLGNTDFQIITTNAATRRENSSEHNPLIIPDEELKKAVTHFMVTCPMAVANPRAEIESSLERSSAVSITQSPPPSTCSEFPTSENTRYIVKQEEMGRRVVVFVVDTKTRQAIIVEVSKGRRLNSNQIQDIKKRLSQTFGEDYSVQTMHLKRSHDAYYMMSLTQELDRILPEIPDDFGLTLMEKVANICQFMPENMSSENLFESNQKNEPKVDEGTSKPETKTDSELWQEAKKEIEGIRAGGVSPRTIEETIAQAQESGAVAQVAQSGTNGNGETKLELQQGGTIIYRKKENLFDLQGNYTAERIIQTLLLIRSSGADTVEISRIPEHYQHLVWAYARSLGFKVYSGEEELKKAPGDKARRKEAKKILKSLVNLAGHVIFLGLSAQLSKLGFFKKQGLPREKQLQSTDAPENVGRGVRAY
ncbi:MAG: hypothetical protein JW855_02170 [Gammaproteobacteria bacterium]|nr:hypothetical protein [Gammaproteobacteria bacterium]